MGVYIGVDFHARTQSVCWCDTATGEIQERVLDPLLAMGSPFPLATNATFHVPSLLMSGYSYFSPVTPGQDWPRLLVCTRAILVHLQSQAARFLGLGPRDRVLCATTPPPSPSSAA